MPHHRLRAGAALAMAVALAAALHREAVVLPAPPVWRPATLAVWLSRQDAVHAALGLARAAVLAGDALLVGWAALWLIVLCVRAPSGLHLAARLTPVAVARLLAGAAAASAVSTTLATGGWPSGQPSLVASVTTAHDVAPAAATGPHRAASTPTRSSPAAPAGDSAVLIGGPTVPLGPPSPPRAPGPHRSQPHPPPAPTAQTPPPSPPPAPPSRQPAPGGAAAEPTAPTGTWVVRPGDSFWSIAEAVVASRTAPPDTAQVASYWLRLVASNRELLVRPGDSDLLLPGQQLTLPA